MCCWTGLQASNHYSRLVANFLPPEQWYASLPKAIAGVGALITNPSGQILLVDPKYRPEWTFPGGAMDAGEFPHETCGRELREELGMEFTVGNLLVVDWVMPAGQRPVPMAYYLFDCGQLDNLSTLRVQEDELDEARFFSLDEALHMVMPHVAPRLTAAVTARRQNNTTYLPGMTIPVNLRIVTCRRTSSWTIKTPSTHFLGVWSRIGMR